MSLPLMPHWWELSHMASPSCKGGWEMSNWAVMFLATILYLFFKNNFTYLFFGPPLPATRESLCKAAKTQDSQKINK